MPLFSYTAVNDRKERINGMVDAMSLQAGRNALQESGFFVEEIHEATPMERESTKPWETVSVQEPVEGLGTEGLSHSGPNDQVPVPSPQHLAPNYYPLLDTVRLYAGWLLAWYILVIALGAYKETKQLPFTIPLIEGLWQSVLIIRAAFGVFIFLMLTSLHRFFGNRAWVGGWLGLLGAFLFYVFFVNT